MVVRRLPMSVNEIVFWGGWRAVLEPKLLISFYIRVGMVQIRGFMELPKDTCWGSKETEEEGHRRENSKSLLTGAKVQSLE